MQEQAGNLADGRWIVMKFDCCSRYKQCWEGNKCINPYPDLREQCSYKRKLEQGRNLFKESKEEKKVDLYKFYICINNRIFTVFKRSSHGWWSYPIGVEEREIIRSKLHGFKLEFLDHVDESRCQDEIIAENERACCRIILSIGKERYHIMNYDGRLVTEKTAQQIRNYLLDRELSAATEFIKSSYYTKPQKKRVPPASKPKEESKKTTEKKMQNRPKLTRDEILKPIMGNQITMDEYLRMLA